MSSRKPQTAKITLALRAIPGSKGNICEIARRSGLAPDTVTRYARTVPEIVEALQIERGSQETRQRFWLADETEVKVLALAGAIRRKAKEAGRNPQTLTYSRIVEYAEAIRREAPDSLAVGIYTALGETDWIRCCRWVVSDGKELK